MFISETSLNTLELDGFVLRRALLFTCLITIKIMLFAIAIKKGEWVIAILCLGMILFASWHLNEAISKIAAIFRSYNLQRRLVKNLAEYRDSSEREKANERNAKFSKWQVKKRQKIKLNKPKDTDSIE